MNVIKFVAIIALISNGVYCYIPHGDLDLTSLPKPVHFPLQQSPTDLNNRPIYDSGIDSPKPTSNLEMPNLLVKQNFPASNEYNNIRNNINENSNDLYNSLDERLLSLRKEDDDEDDDNDGDVDVDDATNNAIPPYLMHNNDNTLPRNHEILDKLKEDIKTDENIAIKSALLLKLLEESPDQAPLPVVYVEDEATEPNEISQLLNKRSGRYYRRYPWKRQNKSTRSRYEAEARYLCVPSREDVYKLLVGLHENRNGNHHKTIQFCNRKRPAKAVFTNIRFLG